MTGDPVNIAPKVATADELAYPDGAILYHLSEDQYRALRAGGMARELIEIEWVTLSGSHLLDSIWVVGPHERRHGGRPVALAVVHEDGQILFAPGHTDEAEQARRLREGAAEREEAGELGEALEQAVQEIDQQAVDAVREIDQEAVEALGAAAEPVSLNPEQWADFVLILDVALQEGFIAQDEAAKHRHNKREPVEVELARIIRAIHEAHNPSQLAADAHAAAVELLRELGQS